MDLPLAARIARSRTGRALTIVAAVGLLSAGLIASAPTLASGPGYSAVYDTKADCGAGKSNTYTTVGYAVFSRDGDTLTLNYYLIGAQPNVTFYIDLYTNPFCNFDIELGTITTDGSGDGSGTFVRNVSGYSKFFGYAHDSGYTNQNETRTKTLH